MERGGESVCLREGERAEKAKILWWQEEGSGRE